MKKQYVVMVINHIFEGENMLIIKWNGGQITEKFNETIRREDLHKSLEAKNMPLDCCTINVVEEGWDGNPRIGRWEKEA